MAGAAPIQNVPPQQSQRPHPSVQPQSEPGAEARSATPAPGHPQALGQPISPQEVVRTEKQPEAQTQQAVDQQAANKTPINNVVTQQVQGGEESAPPSQKMPQQQATQTRQPVQPQPDSTQVAAKAGSVQAADEVRKKEDLKKIKYDENKADVSDVPDESVLIADMKETIKGQAHTVAKDVNRSAFKYMYKNTDWINENSAQDAEKFFTIKIPKVLASELSRILNAALGLNDTPESR